MVVLVVHIPIPNMLPLPQNSVDLLISIIFRARLDPHPLMQISSKSIPEFLLVPDAL